MKNSAKNRRFRPMLQTMDDRIVPATLVDLTTAGAEGSVNGAIVQQVDAQEGGIDSFLRIKHRGVEEGFNTNARPLELDARGNRQNTHALRLGKVPKVEIDGVTYREFRLDIQEKTNSPYLSVDELRFYISNSKFLTGYDADTKTLAGLNPLWDMDAAGDLTIKLDSRLNQGTGRGDMVLLVPNSVFAGHSSPRFIYLYSKFGGENPASGGFEQWAVRKLDGNPPPPPPPLSTLSGVVFFDDYDGVYQGSELGFAGIQMLLVGTDDLGQAVARTVLTGENGYYEFLDVRPGTYSIYQTQEPAHPFGGDYQLIDGLGNVGSLGGTSEQIFDYVPEDPSTYDGILNITVGFGQNGTGYNFLEVEAAGT